MGIEGGRLRSAIFFWRKKLTETFAFGLPGFVLVRGEDLRNATPADIADQRLLFFRSRATVLLLNDVENLNGPEIGLTFFLKRPAAYMVGREDAVIALTAYSSSSGGRSR